MKTIFSGISGFVCAALGAVVAFGPLAACQGEETDSRVTASYSDVQSETIKSDTDNDLLAIWQLPDGGKLGIDVKKFAGLSLVTDNPFVFTVAYWAPQDLGREATIQYIDTKATLDASDGYVRAFGKTKDGARYQFFARFPQISLEGFDFGTILEFQLMRATGGILGAFEERTMIISGGELARVPAESRHENTNLNVF